VLVDPCAFLSPNDAGKRARGLTQRLSVGERLPIGKRVSREGARAQRQEISVDGQRRGAAKTVGQNCGYARARRVHERAQIRVIINEDVGVQADDPVVALPPPIREHFMHAPHRPLLVSRV